MKLREMVELAALAVGSFVYVEDMGWIAVDKDGNRGAWWNPAGDDGDSFRLMVALGLIVSQGRRLDGTPVAYAENETYRACENHGSDPLAATRMAVLRCAAEIGKSIC